MSTVNVSPSKKAKLDRSGITRLVQAPLFILLLGALLFGVAGTSDWPGAWAFLTLFVAVMVVAAVWSLRNNPDLLNERGKVAENTKAWDKVILALYTVLLLATMVVAGLDRRFGWSSMPVWVQILGGVGLVLAMALVYWVATSNAFLSTVVRIQDDRGQQVVTSGPYRYVRHPMYSADVFLFLEHPVVARLMVGVDPGDVERGRLYRAHRAGGQDLASRAARLRRICNARALPAGARGVVGGHGGSGNINK